MGSIFSLDGKFFAFMSKIADLIILNILWCICCVPIVTIGPATIALYYVTLKMVKNEESYIFKSFFKSFRLNLKQGIGIWVMLFLSAAIVIVDIYIMVKWDFKYKFAFIVVFLCLLIVWSFITLYVFPLLSTFDNTVKQTIKNSLLMSIRHLPKTILMFLITLIPLLLFAFIPQFMPIGFLLGGSLVAYLNSIFFSGIFKLYMPEEEEQSNDDSIFSDTSILDNKYENKN